MDFKMEYEAEFYKPTANEKLGNQLWIEYDYWTEQYDKFLCVGTSDLTVYSLHDPDVVIPYLGWQKSASSKFAKKLHTCIFEIAKSFGMSRFEMGEMRKMSSRYKQKHIDELFSLIENPFVNLDIYLELRRGCLENIGKTEDYFI